MVCDVTFHPGWWNRHAGVCFTRDFFADPQVRIESDIMMRRTLFEKFGALGLGEEDPKARPILGSDLIASGFLYSEILGCEVRYSEADAPEVRCASIDDEEALKLTATPLDESPIWQNVENQIQTLCDKYGYVESAINLQGILNLALDLRGEQIFVDLLVNEELACNVFEECYKLTLAVGKRLSEVSSTLSGGVTAITKRLSLGKIYVHSNCSVEMISGSCYRQSLLEYDQRLSRDFQPYGIHHCGQSLEHVAQEYAEVPDLSFVEVGAGSDIAAVRESFPKTHLNLRYSPVKLVDVTVEQLRIDLRHMYERAGGAGSMASVSCVGIDADTPDSQVIAFLELCGMLDG